MVEIKFRNTQQAAAVAAYCPVMNGAYGGNDSYHSRGPGQWDCSLLQMATSQWTGNQNGHPFLGSGLLLSPTKLQQVSLKVKASGRNTLQFPTTMGSGGLYILLDQGAVQGTGARDFEG